MNFRARGINSRDYQIFADSVEKETSLKLKWNDRYSDLKNYEPSKMDWQGKVNEIHFNEFCEKNKFREPVIKIIPKKQNFEDDINEYLVKLGIKSDKNSSKLNAVNMYEPDTNERKFIYKGISHDHEGRFKYLQARKEHVPEKRYPFPVTSSMNIGWNVYDENLKLKNSLIEHARKIEGNNDSPFEASTLGEFPSPYGMKNVVASSFNRNNGCLSENWKNDIIKARST